MLKDTIPATADDPDFDFEQDWDGDNGGPADFVLADNDPGEDSGLIPPNQTYTVEEFFEPGWQLVGVVCNPSGNATTDVTVIDATQGTQVVGGGWSGSPHVLGTTYALHTVDVDLGRMRVEARGTGGFGGPFSGTLVGSCCWRSGLATIFSAPIASRSTSGVWRERCRAPARP